MFRENLMFQQQNGIYRTNSKRYWKDEALWLAAHTAFPEKQGLISSSHIRWLTTLCNSSFRSCEHRSTYILFPIHVMTKTTNDVHEGVIHDLVSSCSRQHCHVWKNNISQHHSSSSIFYILSAFSFVIFSEPWLVVVMSHLGLSRHSPFLSS